jgi:hypothetical protein
MNKIKIKKIPKTDLDYVELYAENLKENPKLFEQHKMLIDSQIRASKSLFSNFGKGQEFKLNARKYLRGVGLLE